MAKTKQLANPFYVLLVIIGIVFLLTICVYAVMTVTDDRMARTPSLESRESPLLEFMDDHGNSLILWELVALAVATVGAIATDRYWTGHDRAEPPETAAPD